MISVSECMYIMLAVTLIKYVWQVKENLCRRIDEALSCTALTLNVIWMSKPASIGKEHGQDVSLH